MLRPSRPLTIALLWLAIVLLPVRAWATATMPTTMAGGAAILMQSGDDVQGSASMPCHGEQQADNPSAPKTCSLCDVCHGAFAGLPAAQPALPALPPAVPCAAAERPVEPAVLAGPERPPRIVLA
jgi:cytochrome c553